METSTFINNERLFAEPVAFKCEVQGNKLFGEIVGEINNPLNYEFKVRFSNGVSFNVWSCELGGWAADTKYSGYVNGIKDHLDDFQMVMRGDWHKFELKYKGEDLLVWVAKKQDEEGESFSVHFKGDYRFHLRKRKAGWEAKSIRVVDPEVIDEKLAEIISTRIDVLE